MQNAGSGWPWRSDRWYIFCADLLACFPWWECTNRYPWTRTRCKYLSRWHSSAPVSARQCSDAWIAGETWSTGRSSVRLYCSERHQNSSWGRMTCASFDQWPSRLFRRPHYLFSSLYQTSWRCEARSSRGPSFIYYQKYYRLVTVV